MFKSLELIDFNNKIFLGEVLAINSRTPGAFSYNDLGNMSFDDYEYVIKLLKDMEKNGRQG